MSKLTSNYNFVKPELTDIPDITVISDNLDLIDSAIKTEANTNKEYIDNQIIVTREQLGSPLVAHTVSEMEDKTHIYVYVGSETGYTAGNWYYYDGSDWVSGGVYNSEGIQTDKTLTVPDMSADAEVVGDEITDLKSAIVNNGLHYKNLIGLDGNVLYPVDIPPDAKITMSTADGEALNQTSLELTFYDLNKNSIGYYNFTSASSKRTVVNITEYTIKYLAWNKNPVREVQVELGDEATSYVPYQHPLPLKLTEIEQDISDLETNGDYYKNLIGLDGNVLYPVDIPPGAKLTMSTADGEALGQTSLDIHFYDSNQEDIGHYNFTSAYRYRTVVNTTEYTIKYLSWNKNPVREVQVELGDEATDYIPYSLKISDPLLVKNILEYNPDSLNDEVLRERTFNASYHVGSSGFSTVCKNFSTLMLGDTINDVNAPIECESFLFFTDPHLIMGNGWEQQCYEFISQIQKYYNSTPTSFCLCGGDWLGNSDLPNVACYKMGFIDGFMHSMFDNCYMIVGNHDTNYQGKSTEESERYTTRLSNQSIVDLWYRGGKAYYTFDGAHTKFYIFDTGTEGQALASFNNYGYEQAEWFAESLETDNSPHIALALHMIYQQTAMTSLQPLAQLLLQIAEAYNNRISVTVNGVSHSYENNTGKIEFTISGHTHEDRDFLLNGIRNIVTTNVVHGGYEATFDLVFVDYDKRNVTLKRVGYGSDRVIGF